jgi:hypothetical protein
MGNLMTKKILFPALTAACLFALVATIVALVGQKNRLIDTGRTLAADNAALTQQNARGVANIDAAEERAATAEARAEKRAKQIIARAQLELDNRAERLDDREAELDARAQELDSREAAFTDGEGAVGGDTDGDACHPSYEGACLDPAAYDYDCDGGSGDGPLYTGYVTVVGPDDYGLDGDGDGQGCE